MRTPLHKLLTSDQLQEFQRLLGSKTSRRRYASRKGGSVTGPTSPAPEPSQDRMLADSIAEENYMCTESGGGEVNLGTTASNFGNQPFVVTSNEFTTLPALTSPQNFAQTVNESFASFSKRNTMQHLQRLKNHPSYPEAGQYKHGGMRKTQRVHSTQVESPADLVSTS